MTRSRDRPAASVSRAARRTSARPGAAWSPLFASFALLAAFSLLLLPAAVLEHRLFLEGSDFGRAILEAFPKDPLYPIASVNRLWLFVLFAGLLSAQADGRALYRRLFRGIAWAAIAAVVLGLLDFAGVLSLDRYNLSHLFYGAQYRRLQSTFGNPSWFACFVACALPFVLLEFQEARGRARVVLAAVFPLCAASLFLSGARAAWLAVLLLLAALIGLSVALRRRSRALPAPDRLSLAGARRRPSPPSPCSWRAPSRRPPLASTDLGRGRPGVSRASLARCSIAGLGLTSPRRVAAEYALELARLKPLLGLGYESFNLHLRAQLEMPGLGRRAGGQHGGRRGRDGDRLRRQPQHLPAGPDRDGRPRPRALARARRSRVCESRPGRCGTKPRPKRWPCCSVSWSSTSTACSRAWRTSR